MATSVGFWTPRRTPRVLDTGTRCRPSRMRTSAILRPPSHSVNFQVKTFRLFGKLNKTETTVHNTLPNIDTIETEKTLMNFHEKQQAEPDRADYGDFYRQLSTCITPQPSRSGTARSVGLSSRSVDTRVNMQFHLSPSVASHWASRPLSSRQSVISRLGTGWTSLNLTASGNRSLPATDRRPPGTAPAHPFSLHPGGLDSQRLDSSRLDSSRLSALDSSRLDNHPHSRLSSIPAESVLTPHSMQSVQSAREETPPSRQSRRSGRSQASLVSHSPASARSMDRAASGSDVSNRFLPRGNTADTYETRTEASFSSRD